MAVTPFRAVNFQPNQLLTEDLLDQLASNQNYLFEMRASATWTGGSLRRAEGVRLISGRSLIAATKRNYQGVTVGFGNYFSAGCTPNITATPVSTSQRRYFITINGIGTLYPDNRGFQIYAFLDAQTPKKQNKIAKSFYVSWIAMGY